eukprot:COSAG01_NODE_29952_length_626_cov_1.250474_1_plen_168_part_00
MTTMPISQHKQVDTELAGEAGTSSSNSELPPPAASPGAGGTARGNSANGEGAPVDPATQAETFLQENEQMCLEKWKHTRRAVNKRANMATLECFDEDGQPLCEDGLNFLYSFRKSRLCWSCFGTVLPSGNIGHSIASTWSSFLPFLAFSRSRLPKMKFGSCSLMYLA